VTYDPAIIRPAMNNGDIKMRGLDMPADRKKAIKKALLTLHTLETMAVNIYRFQITKENTEYNRQLIAAMCNEMTHLQDFQVKLMEFGWRPSIMRWPYSVVGFALGTTSRLRGKKAVLNTGIWTETKAVHHYGQMLQDVDWDDDTREVVKKDQADEQAHIDRWRTLLLEMSGVKKTA